MGNCFMSSSMNVLEGGIVSGTEGSIFFSCNNCTFLHNERVDWRVGNTERNSTTQTQTYKNAEWNECAAPCGGALYVHDNSSATLTVENSSFVKCNATETRGGGIYVVSIAECTVKHSTFIECYCSSLTDTGGACVGMYGLSVQILVTNCSFIDGWSENDGGGIGIWSSKSMKTNDCVLDCSFINCSGHNSSSSDGGALINWDAIDKIVVHNCLFQECHSDYRGGAAAFAPQGNDIYVHDNSTDSQLVWCYSTRTEGVRYFAYGLDKSEWLPNNGGKCRFVASTQTQPKAKDTFSCGLNESYSCLTISHCLSQMIVGFVEEMKVLSGTVVEGKGVVVGGRTISVNGVSPAGSAIETKFEGNGLSLFWVGTGELSVSDLSVVHNSSLEKNRKSILFEVQGSGGINLERTNVSMGSAHSEERSMQNSLVKMGWGSLMMKDVRWGQTFSTTSVISLPQGFSVTLSLGNCTFNNIVRTTAGSSLMNVGERSHSITFKGCTIDGCGSEASDFGGGMMVEMGNVGSLNVKGGVVKNCYASATQGRGGGIGLKVRDTNANFQISSAFEVNRAKWGSDIFVDSINLESTAKSERIACLTASFDSFEKVRGYDNGNTSLIIPLCIYLLPTPEEIFVSNNEAYDHSHCGIVQFPCLTLKHSLTRQTETKKVVVSGMILMSDELALKEKKHEIRGNDEQSGWTVSDASETSNSAMITTYVETKLSKLIFSLPPSLSHSTFISSSSQLTLSQCSLSLQNPLSELTFLFLSVESGTLTIESFSASSITLNGNPLISLSGSSANTGLMSTKWLNMTNSNFTEIERAAGNGGCVSIDNSDDEDSNSEINIEKCDFDGCSVLADESRGGAINAQLKGNIQMDIVSCTFTGCTAPAGEEKTGFGGGMALKLIDDHSSFVISSPIFDSEEPNVAKCGNDLFVESSNLTKSITNISLPFVSGHLDGTSLNSMRGFDGNDTANAIPLIYFWRAIGSEIFIRDDGKDVCTCGFSDYPCLSIDYSLDRLPEGNERIISIIGKGYLQKSVDVSGISVKSDDEEMCSLECLSSLEGAEGAAMKISGISNFELMKFLMPSSFRNGVSYFIDVGANDGLLTLKDCSFTKNEESREGTINFGLIKADEGTVVLEFVSMQSLCFSKDFISVLSTTALNMKNLTMKNIELDGASGLRISKSSGRENNEVEQNIIIEWSIFEEVTQNTTDDIPIIRNDNDDEPLKMVIRNTTMKGCGGMRCGKGGGMFCVLNEGGSFDCSFCTISECFCSTTGRGGWLFLECTSVVEQPLNFVLSNITFRGNSAFRGRDVYVRCYSIENQIVDEQFLLDFRLPFVKDLAIWGATTDSFVGEEDLLLRVVKYQSETIFVSSATGNHGDSKQCGKLSAPCHSLDVGVQHIIPSSYSQLLVSDETIINGECDVHDVTIRSLESPSTALVHLNSTISGGKGSLLETSEKVRIESVKFNFDQLFSYSGSSIIHESSGQLSLLFVDFSSIVDVTNIDSVVLNSTLLIVAKGILHVDNCSISMLSFKKPSFLFCGDEISLTNMKLEQIESTRNVVEIGNCGSIVLNGIDADGVKLSEGCIISIGSSALGSVSIGSSSFKNCSRNSEGASVLSSSSTSAQIVLSNCSCSACNSLSSKGSMMEMNNAKDVSMHICEFEGLLTKESESERNNAFEEICEWSGSLVHSINTSLMMKDVTILNASSGGLSVSSGNVKIEAGNFSNNNPSKTKYPSLRRNIICSDSASLSISSLKGGDGVKDDSSMWILNDGCLIEGIVSERDSSFFIPVLESVEAKETTDSMKLAFKGMLLIPCNLSFTVVKRKGEEKEIEKHDFDSNGFLSEKEAEGSVSKDLISSCEDEIEVSVHILFGNSNSPFSTQSFVLKNKSEVEPKGDEIISKGEEQIEWSLIAFIGCIVALLIFVVLFVVVVVLLRKKLRESEKKVEKEKLENEQIMGKIEKRRRENYGGSFEMSEMPSTLLEGMTSQIPLLIDNDEDLPEPPSMTDEILNENDLPDLESPLPFDNDSVSGMQQSHSFNVISAKKPFREKEKKSIKTLHSVIHSVQGNFTLGTRAMDVVDGKEVVKAVAELFKHLISVDDERMEMLARQLCPYSIFVEEGNNEIYLLTEELEDEKEKEEMKRWSAPEEGDEEEGIEQAVVFTLGLIFHEMTTGEVPLSECDPEEAQEMMKDGVRPLTEGIEGEEMVELMEKMWADEPNERPKLTEVIQLLMVNNAE
ncbi:uncharacterized protein MONOS_5524 [Monocercomonoides exilis]|uniref:uncharacterized protein n=1 Tax=Monocercomonoides exilis TaxID=2049356 RepID=UPI0035599469|nr:hypothetical protein MONOS_5524 [Monocercomonoides exilis]|eukprot:MONOS_5524.1-p1 / transcript=MONOS_5524.1 / gene=MONOS_5524 / organism=Monocercomonoides_exilis_PA203 / gene_product=unspecified product / transcript_product=unspecified product / location=Mono_scaffold00162:19790-26512(-) / protein_length=2221 / sequence_SO=supercontig / SO=protein_coding / is_pseudo=false